MVKEILKNMMVDHFTLFYLHKISTEEIYEEIFKKQAYDFTANNDEPFIIDAGSNVGMATLFFKLKYPKAKILCFEPDPNIFPVLKKNIQFNKLNNITLVNAALANREEERIAFYGSLYQSQPNTLGNSIVQSWGHKNITDEGKVQATKLSLYIDKPVDFLKLDVEGAEHEVFEDIEHKLPLIREFSIEVHETKHNDKKNFDRIVSLLERNNFELEIEHKIMREILPQKTLREFHSWIEEMEPELYMIKARNKLGKY